MYEHIRAILSQITTLGHRVWGLAWPHKTGQWLRVHYLNHKSWGPNLSPMSAGSKTLGSYCTIYSLVIIWSFKY